MFYFDFKLLLFLSPAILLGLWAQMRIRSTYNAAQRQPAPMSGAAAARYVLDSAGLESVRVEQVPGHLSDHYDPREKVLRLSPEVYSSRTMAAVGIAAHEAGHAIQDARNYLPLGIRNAVVPTAGFGSGAGMFLLILGMVFHSAPMLFLGIILFSAFVFFQVINLPVEFNASARAKAELVSLGVVSPEERVHVDRVLNAAAWTYVAATLQSILTLLYYVTRFTSSRH